MLVLLPLAVLMGLAPEPSPTRAELELRWEAPQGCPERDVVLSRVETQLGRPLGEAEQQSVEVEARVVDHEGRLELLLHTRTTAGSRERHFEGQTCEVLVDTAALVIATALDPTLALGGEPEPEPEPEPQPQPQPASCPEPEDPRPCPEPTPPPPVVTPRESKLGGSVRVGGAGLLGPLPGLAPGLAVAVALLRQRLRIELGLHYWFPRRAEASERAGAGGEIGLWTLAARGCWEPGVSIVGFPLCAGVQSGPMRGEGYGLGAPSSTRLAWVAAEAGAAVVVRPWSWLGVWLGADLLVPLTRPGFRVDDLGLVHRAAVVGGQASLGFEVRFGAAAEPRSER